MEVLRASVNGLFTAKFGHEPRVGPRTRLPIEIIIIALALYFGFVGVGVLAHNARSG